MSTYFRVFKNCSRCKISTTPGNSGGGCVFGLWARGSQAAANTSLGPSQSILPEKKKSSSCTDPKSCCRCHFQIGNETIFTLSVNFNNMCFSLQARESVRVRARTRCLPIPRRRVKKKKDEVDEPFDITSAVLKGVLGRSGVRKQVDHKKKGKKQLQKRTLSDERT